MQYNVFGSKHWSNVQGNKENCWSRKQTRKRRRISGFCQFIIFLGIKNVRVGGKILESVGRPETHIFFFWPKLENLTEIVLNIYDTIINELRFLFIVIQFTVLNILSLKFIMARFNNLIWYLISVTFLF